MKVLFATPLSAAGADTNYLRTLVSAVLMQEPGITIDFASSDCGCVGFARNELAFMAEDRGFDRILWCDDDMVVTPKHITRLLSHDVDWVSGAYAKRKSGPPHWLFVPLKGAVQQSNGLLECTKTATGIHAIKVSCLTTLRSMFPEEEFLSRETADSPVQTRMNWYKMFVGGPRTADARLKRVKKALASYYAGHDAPKAVQEISDACFDVQPAGTLYGEDFAASIFFREAGFKIYVDLGMPIVNHLGLAAHPIQASQVGFGEGIPVKLPQAED